MILWILITAHCVFCVQGPSLSNAPLMVYLLSRCTFRPILSAFYFLKLWWNAGLYSHCLPGADGSWYCVLGPYLTLLHQTGTSSNNKTIHLTHVSFLETPLDKSAKLKISRPACSHTLLFNYLTFLSSYMPEISGCCCLATPCIIRDASVCTRLLLIWKLQSGLDSH